MKRVYLPAGLAGLAGLALLAVGCDSSSAPPSPAESLEPYPNPFTDDDPMWSPQPLREKPQEVLLVGDAVYVSLPGTPDHPGHHVIVLDADRHDVIDRIEVGAGPVGMALHPDGRWLVVLNRYSHFASIIDVGRREVVHRAPIDAYAVEAAFTPDGRQLYTTNRWRDAVIAWRVESADDGLRLTDRRAIAVDTNPRDIAVSADGRWIAAAALTGGSVSLIDTERRRETHRVELGAPANGLAFAGDWLVVATLSASTHHRPLAGPDTDGDGRPGDSTPNVNFQDLQNELAVIRVADGEIAHRYTSDTTCCRDFRDVDPDDTERHGDLLPPRETWIVGGALPEQIAVDGETIWVIYSASNEIQRFAINADDGHLEAGPVWTTGGHNPHGVAPDPARDQWIVAHRLGESVGFYADDGELEAVVPVNNEVPFPATDAEIGELFNFVTASFSVDGDQSCAHCHREGGNIDKAFSMPLTRYGGLGQRMTMAYRGAADSRPWFFEAAMDQSNFKPVINEFARIENFCCTDYTLFPRGAPPGCADDPPPECKAPNAGSTDGFDAARDRAPASPRPTAHGSRDALYRAAAKALVGRETSFGDGLFFEDPITGDRQPIPLDFDGMTRALGLFLMTEPRLLPNPNPTQTSAVRRGRALFESAATGCATCHPAPTFAASTDHNPFDVPLRMGPVVTPVRDTDGINLDLFAEGFAATFPKAEMDGCDAVCGPDACTDDANVCDELRQVRFGVTGLRGIWDRAPSLLHDGRANGLREALCTPGHPALEDGEIGYNERDGIPDTHGGTSHLSPQDIADLIEYIETL